jgi:methylenetetrahydrofolate reductase (NADPH)
MKIADLFNKKKVVYSFEIFPPKLNSSIEIIYNTLSQLENLKPDYLSVTYGAGGSSVQNRTCEIASIIKNKYDIEPLSHLTCINSKKEEVKKILDTLKQNNVSNILAMRGDKSPNTIASENFQYSYQLMDFIKQNSSYNLAGACYPEGHPECESLEKDIEYMKLKEESGAEFFITQLFFENSVFYEFLEQVRKIGIKAPIQVGIMPVTSTKQIERIVYLSGAKIPHKLSKLLARYGNNKEAMTQAGIMYATEQIVDLLENNVDGIHLYSMNNLNIARKITENIDSIISAENTSYIG